VSVDAASAGCCCAGLGVPYEQICDIWRACPAPPTISVSYSRVVTDTLRMPDGSSWEEWRWQPSIPVPHTYAISLGGTLTRDPDGVYRGTLSGSVTGGGEVPEYLNGSHIWAQPEGVPVEECQPYDLYYPDCDSVCRAFRLAEVRYAGSLFVQASVRCQPWQIGGSAWDIGSALSFGPQNGSGTVTTTLRCPGPDQPATTTEPWSPVGLVVGDVSFSRGCPPGTQWTQVSTSETGVVVNQIVSVVFLRETDQPPFTEVICETDRECGEGVFTFTVEQAVSVG
jgi:hypothetical protein